MPNIKEISRWDFLSVKQACINHSLYTRGDSEEYAEMLSKIDNLYPSTDNIYAIAKDIEAHSTEQTITNVMFILRNEAVKTFYEIEE